MRRPARRRAWQQAAMIAAPIILLISALVLGALVWSGAAASLPPMVRAAASLAGGDDRDAAFASPGDGTTGTAPLPPLPASLRGIAATAATGVTAAQPFSMRGASALDRARALECLSATIYYEAASEPDDGQRAVAQVVLNRVRHPAFPATVCGVVYQGVERGSGCQFSFACDGAMARIPNARGWARAARTAAAALAGSVFAPVGLATHYHTYAVTPSWNRSLVMTDVIGAHFFHRWKGVWGTAAAFHQAYAGHEPQPLPPTPRLADPIIAMDRAVPVAAPLAALSGAKPRLLESGAPLAEPTPAAPTPESIAASQILDRWKDSGKPLR